MAEELLIRPGAPSDLPAVAEVMLASRRAAFPAMPAPVHPDGATRAFVGGWDLAQREVWVAETESIVGFAALKEDWLDFLFVLPDAARAGVGSALLEVVKARRPDGFGLWVFETNRAARAFYARHGLREVEATDGRDNEERQPDVRMAWAPAQEVRGR